MFVDRAEELDTMSTGEDEPSSSLNGRLRPRKSNAATPSPQNKIVRKTEGKLAQDRPKRTSTPSKASLTKQDDLATKSDTSSTPLFLCPYCDRKFYAKQTASKHARRIHHSVSKQDNFIKCLYCSHSDADSNAIIKHMVDSHPNQYFACLDCHTRFSSTSELAEHKLNVCEKQKPPYRSKLRQKISTGTKKNPKKVNIDDKSDNSNENTQYTEDRGFNGIVISCELKPSEVHDVFDIEDKITTNLILPHSKALPGREKSAVIVLDDLQWNKRIPSNFSFHNSDADQILSRLGVVHRSPRVGESRKDLIRMMDEPNEKFEKCFETSFYSKVAKNVQDNLTKYLDGSFNFNPNRDNKDNSIKTRKSKTSVMINTAEGFPILLAQEQFSRNLIDGFIPRAMAPKHKWKWDTAENDKNVLMLLDQTKRDSHVSNCIITLISSLDIWTQLRMKSKFEGIFKTTPTAKKTEKQNIISMELKEILESRDIPTTSSQVVRYVKKPVEAGDGSELPAYLGLSPTTTKCEMMPAVLSGEWVRPRCYVCCACGEQTRDARALSTHLTSQHPNAQVQHYEIVGETLLSADILKHLYVPPSQISNRTRPPRGFRDCTKCKKSITLEDLHQHMLDCAGDTPTVRRKCRYRPFGVRRRRPRLPDNTIRKKMRKAISSRHRQKPHMRPRPRIRTEVGDAETIRKMIADLPAKRNRISPSNVLRPRRNILKAKKPVKLRAPEAKKPNKSTTLKKIKSKKSEDTKKQNDTDNSSTVDEDDQPLKLSTRVLTRSANNKKAVQCRATKNKTMRKKQSNRNNPNMRGFQADYYNYEMHQISPTNLVNPMFNNHMVPHNLLPPDMLQSNVFRPHELQGNMYSPYYQLIPNQMALDHAQHNTRLSTEQMQKQRLEQVHHNHQMALRHARDNQVIEQMQHQMVLNNAEKNRVQLYRLAQEQHNQLSQVSPNQLTQMQHNQHLQVPHNQVSQMPYNQLVQIPNNQLVIDESHQKLDVNSAGPSNIRQHGNHDDRNIDGSKNIPVGGDNDGSKNNNIAQVPNVPLKHSIASLTSNSEFRDTTTLYRHPHLLMANINKSRMSESVDNRRNFEKDSTAEKLDKPPLPNFSVELKKPDIPCSRRLSNYKADDNKRHLPSLEDTVGSRKSDLKSLSPNDTFGFQESGRQERSPNDSIVSTEVCEESPMLDNTKDFNEPRGPFLIDSLHPNVTSKQLLLPNPIQPECNTKESTALNEEHIKTETDKLKLNKTRKGLNDCIAMLRTKKGLRLDPSTGKYGNDESLDSEMIETKTPITVAPNPPLTVCDIKEKHNDKSGINLTPAQVFSRSVVPEQYQGGSYTESGTQFVSRCNSRPAPQTENTYVQHSKTSAESKYELTTSKPQKVKREITRTRSLSHTDMDKTTHVEDMQKERALFLKPSPKQPSNVTFENMKIRRNSVDGTQILDDPFYQHRFAETTKTLMSMNIPNLTQTMLRDKEDVVDEFQNSQLIVNEIHVQQKFATAIENATRADMEKIDSISVQHITSRRTRRKPVKKTPILEHQPPLIYEQNIPQNPTADKFTTMSPKRYDSYKSFVPAKETNSNVACASYLRAGSIETLPSNASPSPQIRKEAHKRGLNISESNAAIVHNRDDGSQTKIFKKSPESRVENSMNAQNMRRHSIESAITQNSAILQAYRERERSEKALLDKSPSSQGPSYQSRNTTQEEFIKLPIDDETHHDRSNELRSKRTHPSISTFISTTHDTHGIMHVNPESVRSDKVSKTVRAGEIQDTQKMHFENKQLIRKEQNDNNFGSKMDYSKDDGVFPENKSHESKSTVQYSNLSDSEPHRLGIRRSSGNYYTHSSPYQSNVQNVSVKISDNSLDTAPDKDMDTIDIVSCSYQEPVTSYAVPKNQYLNSVYSTSLQRLPCELNMDEMTPLDLSCDPKIRADKTLDSFNKPSEILKNTYDVSIVNENSCNEPLMMVKIRRDYDEQLQSLPQQILMSDRREDDPVFRENREFHKDSNILEKADQNKMKQDISIKRNNIMRNQRNKHDMTLSADTMQPANLQLSDNLLYDSSQKHLYDEGTTSNCSSDHLLPTRSGLSYYTLPQLQTSNRNTYYRQESMQGNALLENKIITQSFQTQNVLEAKLQDKVFPTSDTDLSTSKPKYDILNSNVDSVNQYEALPNIGHHMKANEMNSQNKQMLEAEPEETTTQIRNIDVPENDHALNDQDAETARKFAMLPEELVKILDTIPKDHRTQLLNVLPQYVSTNPSISTSVHKNSVNAQLESKEHTAVSGGSNRLSVNTAVSPSRIIPKKRHSPSQSRGRLNSNEVQTSFSVPIPMTSQLHSSQLECNEILPNNAAKVSQTDISQENKSVERSSSVNFSRESLEKDCDNTEINVVDFSEPQNMNKNKFSTPTEVAYVPSIHTQDLTDKPPSKIRHSNEQTASLRAVRIKTTISKKSLSDEKKLLNNYTYKTSIGGDEEYINSGQIVNPQHHSYRQFTGFQYEKVNINPQTNDDEMMLRASTGQNPIDRFQGDNRSMGSLMTHSITEEKNDDCTPNLYSTVSQNENSNLHRSHQISNPICKTTELESSASASFQATNKVVDHFLLQMSSATISGGENHKEQSVQTFPSCNEPKEKLLNISSSLVHDNDGKDLTTDLNSKSSDEIAEKTIETIAELDRSPRISVESSIEKKNEIVNCSKASQEKTTENKSLNFLQCKIDKIRSLSKISSPKAVISNEEDSEDDVSLAIIKEKHCAQPIISEAGQNTSSIITKQSKSNREKRHKSKVGTKSRKKKTLKKSETVHHNKYTESGNKIHDLIETSDIELSYKNKELKGKMNKKVAKTLPVNTMIIVNNDKINSEMNEFDVNKENNVTENLNKRKEENEITLLPECNQLECQVDHCIDKNIENKREDTTITVSLDANLQSEEKTKVTVEKIKDVSDIVSSCLEIPDICVPLESQSSETKGKAMTPDISNKIETEGRAITDIEGNDESNVLTSNTVNNPVINDNLKKDDEDNSKKLEVSKEGSTKISAFETADSNDAIDFQLCSEVGEINSLSLRRSRRGKSLYAESNYLEEIEQIQIDDTSKKAPLTMKRLILSRVEKDKKRVSECSNAEKSSVSIDDLDLNDLEEVDVPCIKKGKLAKRKKSPCSKRKSKKIKPTSIVQSETDSSDLSNLNAASENFILRELPNPENKIEDIETSKEDVKCRPDSDNATNLSENSTLLENDSVCEIPGVSLVDTKESSAPGKRKLNITKVNDLVTPQSKKSKYHKKMSQSDFDSDDEKVLLETKKEIAAEKHLTEDKDTTESAKPHEKEDNGSMQSKTCEASSEVPQIMNANMIVETHVTCYNRQSSNRRPRSCSVSLKDHADYDPYDIDFEDMVESSLPITKKKTKSIGTVQPTRSHPNTKLNNKNEEYDSSKVSKKSKTKHSNVTNESDSDSSKSDVPLQKYVDEKALESELKNKNKELINEIDEAEKREVKTLNQKRTRTHSTTNSKGKKSTKRSTKDDNSCERETSIEHSVNTNNNVTVDETSQKVQNKEKRTRRTPAICSEDSISVTNEVDQQLLSDKFMENFGFYSERIPRKSNLLASKKISETFHNMISNDIDDPYFGYKEKSSKKSTQNENKKRPEACCDNTISQDTTTLTGGDTIIIQSTESKSDVAETLIANETTDYRKNDDSDLDSVTAQTLMDSEEIRNLENDLFSGLKEAAEASAAYKDSQHTNNFNTIVHDINPSVSDLQAGESGDKNEYKTEEIKKLNKNYKPNKPVGVKDKLYPDIDEIDMFEDKFDKIKRKRRSQAVAAKQVQNNVESNTSNKPRKTEKKKTTKAMKKNSQSTQVLTKGALKGFEGIKISIPTQDLNMPSTVSPPRQQKKRKKITVKRRKASESGSSCSEFDKKEKNVLVKDIYEFKDSEDTELFELRPSTVMDRFRSMHNKNKFKHKERDKAKGDMEKEKQKAKGKERKAEMKEKELENAETDKAKVEERCLGDENQKRQHKLISREGRSVEKDIQREKNCNVEQLNFMERSGKCNQNLNLKTTRGTTVDDDSCLKIRKVADHEITRNSDEYSRNEVDSAVPGTSAFVPDRMDESDYESELSSPEGEFIFYTSDDVNCVCPSDNDSDESDIEKGCGRLNCMYKNRNADKNAAIGNIFKNNAVRCEKTDIKEPEKPKPNLDQLFDSLFETRPSSETSEHRKVAPEQTSRYDEKNDRGSESVLSHDDLNKSKQEHTFIKNKELTSNCDENCKTLDRHDSKATSKVSESKLKVGDKNVTSKHDFICSNNEFASDSNSLHDFSSDAKVKDNIGYSLVSEECTQVNYADIIADELLAKNEGKGRKATTTVDLTVKMNAPDKLGKYDSEDEFDINKPESLTRQYMHLVLPADKATSCAQTEHKSDNSDAESGNESAATKYLKGLSPSEAAKLEIYTMVCAQSTQTVKPEEFHSSKYDDLSRSKSEHVVDEPIAERSRIRLQKFDIRDIAHKSKSSKSIQTEKNKSYKSSCDDANKQTQVENYNDNVFGKLIDHSPRGPDLDSPSFLNEDNEVSNSEYADSFATPILKPTSEKHSPRKSDEGISTSHDYSADALDQASLEDTGVARQRARRKCTVGKQNVLAEHWSSESEFDGAPPRPNSADSVVASVSRKKKSRKKEGHQSGGRRGSRHASKHEARGGGRREESDAGAGPSRAPPGPKIRARPAHHYWSSDGEDGADPQPQHGWIVGDSHKKLVTMLAHAKGRKRNNADKQHLHD